MGRLTARCKVDPGFVRILGAPLLGVHFARDAARSLIDCETASVTPLILMWRQQLQMLLSV